MNVNSLLEKSLYCTVGQVQDLYSVALRSAAILNSQSNQSECIEGNLI